jgi:hypothetical protein
MGKLDVWVMSQFYEIDSDSTSPSKCIWPEEVNHLNKNIILNCMSWTATQNWNLKKMFSAWCGQGSCRNHYEPLITLMRQVFCQYLYFQCNLQRQCCNKLYYCSTQKSFIPVNLDGS